MDARTNNGNIWKRGIRVYTFPTRANKGYKYKHWLDDTKQVSNNVMDPSCFLFPIQVLTLDLVPASVTILIAL